MSSKIVSFAAAILNFVLAAKNPLAEHQEQAIANNEHLSTTKRHVVKNWGFNWDFGSNDFGMNLVTQADLAIGYSALMFYLAINGENLVALNPTIFAELGSLTWLTFRLPYMQITFNFNILPYKMTVLDY